MLNTLKIRFAYYLGDIIYGANDGIITTFAVVSSAAGAGLSPVFVIILGIANLIADGFSMGASRYLALTSEQSLENHTQESGRSPLADGFMTFASFVVVGAFPLLPFFFAISAESVFSVSALATAITLFVVGAARAIVTTRGFFVSGLEMLIVGGIAAGLAYGLGAFVTAALGVTL